MYIFCNRLPYRHSTESLTDLTDKAQNFVVVVVVVINAFNVQWQTIFVVVVHSDLLMNIYLVTKNVCKFHMSTSTKMYNLYENVGEQIKYCILANKWCHRLSHTFLDLQQQTTAYPTWKSLTEHFKATLMQSEQKTKQNMLNTHIVHASMDNTISIKLLTEAENYPSNCNYVVVIVIALNYKLHSTQKNSIDNVNPSMMQNWFRSNNTVSFAIVKFVIDGYNKASQQALD